MAFTLNPRTIARNMKAARLRGRRIGGLVDTNITNEKKNRVYFQVDDQEILQQLAKLPDEFMDTLARDVVRNATDRIVYRDAMRRVPIGETGDLARSGYSTSIRRNYKGTVVYADVKFGSRPGGWAYQATYQELGVPAYQYKQVRFLRDALYQNENRIYQLARFAVRRVIKRYS